MLGVEKEEKSNLLCTECEYKTTINIEWKKAHPWGKVCHFLRFSFSHRHLHISCLRSSARALYVFHGGMFMAFMVSLRELLCNHKLYSLLPEHPKHSCTLSRDSFILAWENLFSSSSLVTYISCKCDVEQSFKPFTIIGLPFLSLRENFAGKSVINEKAEKAHFYRFIK
jgi:hypothetical protein